jgi:hypothetical protein
MKINKLALAFVALGLMVVGSPATGESIMPKPNTHTAMDTLEKFNQPKNFLSMRGTFDVVTFNKNAAGYSEYNFVREDGVHVRQLYFHDRGYGEELSRPDSHYRYGSAFDMRGILQGIDVRFCNYTVGNGLSFDENGNITKKKDFDAPFLAIEKLRQRFLKEAKIDIYDKLKVAYVLHSEYEGKIYYDIFVRKNADSYVLDAYLLDGATGKKLFLADAYEGEGIGPSAYLKYKEYLQSRGEKP